jgi:undecaprenyl-phosphate galactose phosphotransferase/putative colanic acid biosynthesis UDP-glucose lipid carrier transferase
MLQCRCDVTDVIDSDGETAAFHAEARPGFKLPLGAIEPILAVTESAIIIASAVLGGIAHEQVTAAASFHAGLGLVASVVYVLAAYRLGLYRFGELLDPQSFYGRVGASWTFAMLMLAVMLFMLKSGGDVARGSILWFFALGAGGLMAVRHLARQHLRAALDRGAIAGRRAILVGLPSELSRFSRDALLSRFGLDEVERVVLSPPPATNAADEVALQIDDVIQRVRESNAEEVVLALSWIDTASLGRLLDGLRAVPLPVRLLPDEGVSRILNRQSAAAPHIYIVELQPAPLSAADRAAKRMLDIVVASTALVVLSPLLLAAAVAIKLESAGPVIFRQRRRGFNGKPFVIFKLRSMTVQEDGADVMQATRADPRVTRVGRFLRLSSIDELPQLINVLQGMMSIVGPRPHAMAHDSEYGRLIDTYAFRHHVKPGLTGWAQVHGYRGGTPRLELMQRRVTMDLWYIDNWSLALDIQIILRTCFELVKRRNAY